MTYIKGVTYEGKGEYLGTIKGVHKFKIHSHSFYKGKGPKYRFEKA
jgi:hypothetical protein